MAILRFRWFFLLLLPTALTAQPLPSVEHVVVIGVDGLSSAGIRQARTPTLDSLMKHGAATLSAQAVMPSSSSPNWASMIMGARPEEHTVTSNGWQPADVRDSVFCSGEAGALWPTIFRVLRDTYPDGDLACFHDWSDFGRLIEPGVATMLADTRGEDRTAQAAADYLAAYQPLFTFVHLDHVDHAGHEHTWGSPSYVQAVEKADHLIQQVLDGIRRGNIADETVVLITSDHGGKGTKHGGDSPEETTIPWIISGPSIRSGYSMTDFVRTFDTAATVACLLGANPPDCWVGQPVVSVLTPEAQATHK